jgi:diguanylate cyclase (GGDEF)-like protein/PAS domain S-box-containing protein
MEKQDFNKEDIINKFFSNFDDYKFIFDSLDDIVWSMSWPDLKVNYVSKAVGDMVGYSVEEFKKDPLLVQKITHPADKAINEKALEELKENGYSEREIRIIAKNGDIKWVHDKGKIVYDKEGNPKRVIGVMSNITQRKKAEEKLKYNENRYQTIFDSAPIGIMIEDKNGTILEVNEVVCKGSGYSKKELEGSSVIEKFVMPEYHELAKENIKNIVQGKDLEFDIKSPTKDAQIKYYNLKETNIILPDGSRGIISMHQDITERKILENNLREKNVLLSSILESIQDGIVVLNTDLTIRYKNPTIEKWFKNKKDLTDNKCFCAFYDKEEECKNCPVLKSLKTGKMESAVKKLPANMEMDFIEIFSYPIYDKDKKEITGVVEFVKDISERLKQRKELEMMNFSINNADLIIFRLTSEGRIEYANQTAFRKLGYEKDELIGLAIKKVVESNNYIEREKYWDKLKKFKSLNYELNYKAKDNKTFPVEITSQYFKYEDKEYEFIFSNDITERVEKEKEINYLAYKDLLTDLYNRKFFEAELKRLDTKRQLPLSIIMADLNGLKIINDSYGQKMGDKLLIKTAKILKKVLRNEDVLARYGGDEFTILLPQTTKETAQKIVERIKSKSEEQNQYKIALSISLGAATKDLASQKISEILKVAEDKMYQNKLSESRSGKSKIVQGLLNTLNAKSSETKEHAVRMAKLASDFGRKLNLSNSEINRLSLLATLHDIGKTSISEAILTKPGKLTKDEWEIMKKHSEQGYKIASASEEFALVADEILSHHEHWDGKGYPNGLKGEKIPYLARIISIIDAYDVMTNERPYSRAISEEKALEEIENCAAAQFDPVLAEKFVELIKSK